MIRIFMGFFYMKLGKKKKNDINVTKNKSRTENKNFLKKLVYKKFLFLINLTNNEILSL